MRAIVLGPYDDVRDALASQEYLTIAALRWRARCRVLLHDLDRIADALREEDEE